MIRTSRPGPGLDLLRRSYLSYPTGGCEPALSQEGYRYEGVRGRRYP